MADFDVLGPKWQGPIIKWHFSDPGEARYLPEIQRAFNAWDALIDIDFVRVDTVAEADVEIFFYDGANLIYSDFDFASTRAQIYTDGEGTEFFQPQSGEMFIQSYWPRFSGLLWDPEVGQMTAYNGLDYLGGQPSNYSGVHFYNIMLHEIGFSLGLLESTNPDTVMYRDLSGADKNIGYWDQVGIHTLYAPENDINTAPITTIADQSIRAGE
jgi:hypothetical protein